MILINRTALVSAQATSNLARIAPASQNPPPPPSPAASTAATAKPATQFAFSDTPKLSKSLTADFDRARQPSALALAPDHQNTDWWVKKPQPWSYNAKTAPRNPYGGFTATAGASRNEVPSHWQTYGVTGNPETARAGYASATQLFVKGTGDADEVSLNDIQQAGLGDCFLVATLGAVAMQDPKAIKNMIRENADGTYTVTFKQRFGSTPPRYVDTPVTVSADFPGGLNGRGHAQAGDTEVDGRREIWPLVIEKAYAQWQGGYDGIDLGGNPSEMMESITGRPTVTSPDPYDYAKTGKPTYLKPTLSGDDIADALRDGKAVVFSTSPATDPKEQWGLHGRHAYTVTGVTTDSSGRQFLNLYNPWGQDHPQPVPIDQVQSGPWFRLIVS